MPGLSERASGGVRSPVSLPRTSVGLTRRGFSAPVAGAVSRVRLEPPSLQTDSWLDVVSRADGRPAAVWFSTADAVIKLYAP